jgi:hypothetical protein
LEEVLAKANGFLYFENRRRKIKSTNNNSVNVGGGSDSIAVEFQKFEVAARYFQVVEHKRTIVKQNFQMILNQKLEFFSNILSNKYSSNR